MRWGRRTEQRATANGGTPEGWHEGAHWVAGAGAIVHAAKAAELVAAQPDGAPSRAA